MIELRQLTKNYGSTVAVADLTVTIRPGHVTGFLGPNGAGKSTTMRLIAGLDRPTAGAALVDGRPFTDHAAPLRSMGVMLDGRTLHPGRSGRDHLRALAATHGVPHRRVDEVLDQVDLTRVATHRAGTYSTGMTQRLGLAAALLADPSTLMLDEPTNGLDPEGIRWVRTLLRDLAAQGRTVLISSHLMTEMSITADHLLVIRSGRLIADQPTSDLTADRTHALRIRTAHPGALLAALGCDGTTDPQEPDLVTVQGRTAEQVAQAALAAGVAVYELTPVHQTLEDAYLRLTHPPGAPDSPSTSLSPHTEEVTS